MLIRNFLLHTEKMKRLSVALLEQVSGSRSCNTEALISYSFISSFSYHLLRRRSEKII